MKEAHKRGIMRLGEVRRKMKEVSDNYGLHVDPDAYVWQLSVGEQQRVELVKNPLLRCNAS